MRAKNKSCSAAPLFTLLLLSLLSGTALGWYGDSAETVPVNRLAAGVQAMASTRPGFAGSFNLGVGLTGWMSMELGAGYGMTDVATNSFAGRLLFKALVTKYFGGVYQLSFLLGGGVNRYPSGLAGMLLCTSQNFYDLYTGIDADCVFGNGNPRLLMQFLLGIKVKNFLANSSSLFKPSAVFEIGIPLTNDTSFTFILSARMFMDFKILRGGP